MILSKAEYAVRLADNLERQGITFKGAKILDVGIGANPAVVAELQKRGAEVYAIDKDEKAVAAIVKSGVIRKARIKRATARDLKTRYPFAGQKFDVVLCTGAMEYMDQGERADMMHGIYENCLAPDGKCALVVDQYTRESGHDSPQAVRQALEKGVLSLLPAEHERQCRWTGVLLSEYFHDVKPVDVQGMETKPMLFVASSPRATVASAPPGLKEETARRFAVSTVSAGFIGKMEHYPIKNLVVRGIPLYENTGPVR